MLDFEAARAVHEIADYQRRIALQQRLVAQLTKFGRVQAADEARSLLDQLLLAVSRVQGRAGVPLQNPTLPRRRRLSLSRVEPATRPRVKRKKRRDP